MIQHIKIHHIWTLHQHKTESHHSSFPKPRTAPLSDSRNSNYRIYNSVTSIFATRTLFSLSEISRSRTLVQRNSFRSANLTFQVFAQRDPSSLNETAIPDLPQFFQFRSAKPCSLIEYRENQNLTSVFCYGFHTKTLPKLHHRPSNTKIKLNILNLSHDTLT